jgi:hypothetical protein
MNRTAVKSTNIKSVGYDPKSKTLEVEFHSGAVHEYESVPAAVHQKFSAARSPGGFFHAAIRDTFKLKPKK